MGNSGVVLPCPRGHSVQLDSTEGLVRAATCERCGSSFAYVGEARCVRSNNRTRKLPGDARAFAIQTIVTIHTPDGESARRRVELKGERSEPIELVHVRQGEGFSYCQGRTGIYHAANHTIGEQWTLLKRHSWTLWLIVVPMLFAAVLVGGISAGTFGISAAASVVLAAAAAGAVGWRLMRRYRRSHAWPL